MIASLPLLCANGSFIKLEDMKDDQMEKFISFLVQCSNLAPNSDGSVNKITTNGTSDVTTCEPPWWLPDLPFVHPIKRPKKVTRKWRNKLKTLIKLCYKYYNYELLIDLSADLAEQQLDKSIELVPMCGHLINVVNKRQRSVIATIRNENLSYDSNCESPNQSYNIKCEVLTRFSKEVNREIESEYETSIPEQDPYQEKTVFLNYFNLNSKDSNFSSVVVQSALEYSTGRVNFLKAPSIPFSSQLGRRLATKSKYFIQKQTHLKRLERLNRYLNTPPSTYATNNEVQNYIVTRDRYLNHTWTHTYKFPGKTYGSHRNSNISRHNEYLYAMCKPCCVSLTPVNTRKGGSRVPLHAITDDININLKTEPNEIVEDQTLDWSKRFSFDLSLKEENLENIENYSDVKIDSGKTIRKISNRRKNRLRRNRLQDIRVKGFQNFSRVPKVRLSPRLNVRQTRKSQH